MASQAQIAANRRNARASTGPKTEQGKARIARNALRHGLTATSLASADEEEDVAEFGARFAAALAPADPIEARLVERIALAAWHSRRAERAAATIPRCFADPSPRSSHDAAKPAIDRQVSGLAALARYEAKHDRAMHDAYRLIERRQANRLSGTAASRPGSEFCETKPISPAKSAPAAETPLPSEASPMP